MGLPDYPRDKIAAIQQRLDNTVHAIRNNKAYSDTGSRAEIAKAVLAARREANELKDKTVAERNSRRESLQRRLFGIGGSATPAEMMVLRDSRDRAAAIENENQASTKLRLANQAGDTYMARAIAQIAFDKGWRDIVETYVDTAPLGTRAGLEELAQIPVGKMVTTADALAFKLREPDGFFGVRDDLAECIARGDQAVAELRSTDQFTRGVFNPPIAEAAE